MPVRSRAKGPQFWFYYTLTSCSQRPLPDPSQRRDPRRASFLPDSVNPVGEKRPRRLSGFGSAGVAVATVAVLASCAPPPPLIFPRRKSRLSKSYLQTRMSTLALLPARTLITTTTSSAFHDEKGVHLSTTSSVRSLKISAQALQLHCRQNSWLSALETQMRQNIFTSRTSSSGLKVLEWCTQHGVQRS